MARMLPWREQRHIVNHVDASNPDAQVLDREKDPCVFGFEVDAHLRAPTATAAHGLKGCAMPMFSESDRITADGIAKLTG